MLRKTETGPGLGLFETSKATPSEISFTRPHLQIPFPQKVPIEISPSPVHISKYPSPKIPSEISPSPVHIFKYPSPKSSAH